MFGIREQVHQQGDSAIGHANALDESEVDESFQLCPYLMGRCVLEGDALDVPVGLGSHPVEQVQVDVVKLQLLEGKPQGAFDFFTVFLPQLGGDEEVFTLDAFFEAVLEGFTDGFFVAVDSGGVDVPVAVVEDRGLDDWDQIFAVSLESAEANLGHFKAVTESDDGLD